MQSRTTGAFGLGISFMVGCFLLVSPSAEAATTCEHKLEKKVVNNKPDDFRAMAKCSSVAGNNKVRAKMDRSAAWSTKYSGWFTTPNTWRYTSWEWYGISSGYEVGSI